MWFGWLLFAVLGFWLGQRYSDFRELMMARRVSRLIEQRRNLNAEREQWEREINGYSDHA
ncbi:hypothetical protein [Alicyclobacillus tolerans]|uniref:Uncharacterized protein n=1 Tax=Alicyclobacillus tolerans TaxID=90970 RepID=A0A1M6ML47_9BACL|nr:hypothetical protein [Alicyclobacillus montanus]SHJ84179.1 hypothetical protein SAMN05443507_104101 [Alicyclobacillus montanus]